jgi:hypothetical protein
MRAFVDGDGCVCVSDDIDLPAALMMNHAYHRVADAVWDMVSVGFQHYIACLQFIYKISAGTQRTHPHMHAVMLVHK